MGRKKKKKTCPTRVKKKTYPHIEEGEKSTHLEPQLFRGEGGGHSQKEGIFLIPIQSAACRWMLWTSNIVWSMSSQNLRIY